MVNVCACPSTNFLSSRACSGICKFGIKLKGLDPLRKYDICADAYTNNGVKHGPSCLEIKTKPEVIIDRKNKI